MKSFRYSSKFFIAILFLLFLAGFSSAESRWKLISKGDETTIYIDTETLSHQPGGTAKVWVKFVPQIKALLNLEKFTRKIDKQATGEEHTKELLEIECRNRTYRKLDSTAYDKYGSVTSASGYNDKAEWRAVSPESREEKIHTSVCTAKDIRKN